MKPNEDRRVRKTKKLMTDALAELLLEKPLNNITVREIAERADINRGTFYLHYRDVYDMAEQIQNGIFEKFNEIVNNYVPAKSTDSLFPFMVEIFKLLAENADLAQSFIGKNGDAAFVDKLKNVMREKCFTDVRNQLKAKNRLEFGYFYHYIESGCIGLFDAWLKGGMKETPEEMAEFAEKLILNGVKALE